MSGFHIRGNRDGATIGDAIIVIAILVLGAAFLYPSIQDRRREARLDQAISDVEVVRTAAATYLAANQDWPDPSVPGEMSSQLAGVTPAGFGLSTDDYTLQWERWEVVQDPVVVTPQDVDAIPDDDVIPTDSVPPAPQPTFHAIGGVTVYSADGAILAGLLGRYGTSASFVRDTMWTLVLPTRSAPRAGS